MEIRMILACGVLGLAGCLRGPEPVSVPNERPVQRIEFDENAPELFWRSNVPFEGYSAVEAVLKGRNLYVEAVTAEGVKKNFWRLLDPFPLAQLHRYIDANYQYAGRRTMWCEVLEDGTELCMTFQQGGRNLVTNPHSPLGDFFSGEVKTLLLGEPQPGATMTVPPEAPGPS